MKRPLLRLLLAGPVAFAAGAASCPSEPDLGPGVHSWGTFQLCLTRISDTCHAAEAPCGSPATDATRTVTIGVRADGRGLVVTRPGMAPMEGVQTGTRVEATASAPARLCGCDVTVNETVRASLSPEAMAAPDCSDPTDGGLGCGARDGGAESADAGAPEGDAMAFDAGYYSLRGTVTDDVVPAGPGCTCAPCRIEYDVVGRR